MEKNHIATRPHGQRTSSTLHVHELDVEASFQEDRELLKKKTWVLGQACETALLYS